MYNFRFNNLHSLNRRSQSVVRYIPVPQMKCSYCEENGHNIMTCPYDKQLIHLLRSPQKPNFDHMSFKVLKRLAALINCKVSLPRIQIILNLTRYWQEWLKTQDIVARSSDITDCPICMEPLESIQNVSTKCGHKYCLKCFLQSYHKKNSCPMCRTSIIEDDLYDQLHHVHLDNSFDPERFLAAIQLMELSNNNNDILYFNHNMTG